MAADVAWPGRSSRKLRAWHQKEQCRRMPDSPLQVFGTRADVACTVLQLVTETDQAVEKLVRERISATFPEHKFIGEESYAGGDRPELTDEPTWIVDPIDGTT